MWIESEPDFALLEEVWGVRSNPPDLSTSPSPEPVSSLHKAYVEPANNRSPGPIVRTPAKTVERTPRSPTSIERDADPVYKEVATVHISDPVVTDYLSIYKDEYRDRIVERILLRYLHEKEESMHGNSLQNRIKILFSDAKGTDTLFLYAWFAIALFLFLLLIRGPRT